LTLSFSFGFAFTPGIFFHAMPVDLKKWLGFHPNFHVIQILRNADQIAKISGLNHHGEGPEVTQE
jgi:hypothetical protein